MIDWAIKLEDSIGEANLMTFLKQVLILIISGNLLIIFIRSFVILFSLEPNVIIDLDNSQSKFSNIAIVKAIVF